MNHSSNERSEVVSRVVDGDTINVRGEPDTVRILGIDAPELSTNECGAVSAKERLEELIPNGMKITLVFDSVSDHTDRYGRTLAYVETAENNDVGKQLIAQGYVEAWVPAGEPKPTRWKDYKSAEEAAKKDKVGSWNNCQTVGR